MNFTERQYNVIAQGFAKRYFGKELNIPIKINGRKNGGAMGGFVHKNEKFYGKRIPIRIDMSARSNTYRTAESNIDTLLHELTHWFCYVTNNDYDDGEYFFESQLQRIGASSTRTKSFAGEKYPIHCSKCGKHCGDVPSIRKLSKYLKGYSARGNVVKYYYSHCCHASYKQGEVKIVEDAFIPNEKIKEAYQFALELINRKSVAKAVQTQTFAQKQIAATIETPQKQTTELVTPGRRGVTNTQMIPAMEKFIMANQVENLKLLQELYPEVFESSKKYIKKSLQFRFYQMIG